MAGDSSSSIPAATASQFFIHPSENWGQCLVSAVLTDTNFTSWERSMTLVLAGKNKLGFIDGSIAAPLPTDALFPLWTRNNQLLLSWIQRSVSPTIAHSIIWMESARDTWCELKERFSQGDAFRIADLQERIFAFRQNSLSVSEYFTQLKSLWDELSNFRPIPTCACSSVCSCILATIRVQHQGDLVIHFLRGLNESFAAARGSIMLLEPLPSVNRAFSMMIQQERKQNSVLPTLTTESMAFMAQRTNHSLASKAPSFKNKGKKPVCSYCGYIAHTVEVCYKKHGYPHGYKPRVCASNAEAHCVGSSDEQEASVTVARSDWVQFQQQYQRMSQMMQQQPQNIDRFPSHHSTPAMDAVPGSSTDQHTTIRANSVTSVPSDHVGPSGVSPNEDDWYS
ncbi:hypothetical protein LINPERHAP2_LOCUS42462 [Linum perenne]